MRGEFTEGVEYLVNRKGAPPYRVRLSSAVAVPGGLRCDPGSGIDAGSAYGVSYPFYLQSGIGPLGFLEEVLVGAGDALAKGNAGSPTELGGG